MTLRQQLPVIPGVLDQSATRLHQSLLQARQRPVADPVWQHQPPPEIPQVVSCRAQPPAHLVRPEAVAARPRHLHRLLAFFDPLLRRSRLSVSRLVAMNPTRGNSSPEWNSTLATTLRAAFPLAASITPRCPSPGCRWMACGWHADGILHAPLLQCLVDLRLGEGRVGPKQHLLVLLLLPLNLRQQQFLPVVGSANVA